MSLYFIEAVGQTVSQNHEKRTLSCLHGPSLIFWCGGLLAALTLLDWSNMGTVYQIGGLLGGGILLLLLNLFSGWFVPSVLRLLAGYWPGWLGGLQNSLTASMQTEYQQRNEQWQQLGRQMRQLERLEGQDSATLTAAEEEQLASGQQQRAAWRQQRLDLAVSLTSFPAKEETLLPTRLGNLLRASEHYATNHYGLEARIIWPRLWLLLPEATRHEIRLAQHDLECAARLVFWGCLMPLWAVFGYFVPLMLLAPVVGLGMILVGYYSQAISAGAWYGKLIRSAFDLHRFELYRANQWPLPATSEAEKAHGERFTQYIVRGYTNPPIEFD